MVHSLIEYVEYCQGLEFAQMPDYGYLAELIKQMAGPESIDHQSAILTWSQRAVTLQSFPEIYEFIFPKKSCSFEKNGRVKPSKQFFNVVKNAQEVLDSI